MHWILIIVLSFGIVCAIGTFFTTKFAIERKMNRLRRIQGSPHYMPSNPNQYSSLPMKDVSNDIKSKLFKINFFDSFQKIISPRDSRPLA
jgi:hypothetical protein